LIAEALGETLFLDAICRLPQFVQSGACRAAGSEIIKHNNVRIITATHCNLSEAVSKGMFRVKEISDQCLIHLQ